MGLHLNKQKTCREKDYRKELIFNDLGYPQYLTSVRIWNFGPENQKSPDAQD